MADETKPQGGPSDTTSETPAEKPKQEDPRQGLPPTVKLEVPKEGETGVLPFQPDTTKRQAADGRYVKYNGPGTVRIMGPDEWHAAGVDSDDYFEWNYFNKKLIPVSSFSDAQLQYLLRVDDRFEIVEVKSEDK